MSDIKIIEMENVDFKEPKFPEPKFPEPDLPPIPPEPKFPKPVDVDSLIERLEPVIEATTDPEETRARIHNAINISEFLDMNEKATYRMQEPIIKEWTGEKTTAKNFWGYWKNMAKYHQLRTDQSKIASKMMWEPDPDKREEYWQQIMEIDAEMPSTDTTIKFFPVKWIGNLIPLLGQHWEGVKRPQTLELAAAWAIAQGSAAFALGQMGPQALAPEEIVTVPGAIASGFGRGLAAGMSAYVGELEADGEYIDLIKMGIDHKTARSISMGVGVGNLLLETVQIGEWLKTVPGAKGVLSKGIRAVTRKLASEKWLKILKNPLGRITKAGIKNAIFAGKETAEEVAQEGVQIFGQELAIWLHNRAKQGDEIASKLHEAFPRLWQVAKQSFGPFFLMGVPTATVGAFVEPSVSTTIETEEKPIIPEQKVRAGTLVEELTTTFTEKVKQYAKSFRDRAVAEYEAMKKEGIIGRIKRLGKIHIRDMRGSEEAADIPKGLRPQIFTKNENAMDMDEMAASLGMSEDELRQSLIGYKEKRPSERIKDYYEEVAHEFREAGEPEENITTFVRKTKGTPVEFGIAQAYEDLKDSWIGEKDVRKLQIENEGRRLKKKLKEDLGYQRASKHVRDVSIAIQLAIDIQRNPGHVAQYWDKLNDEQKRLVKLSQDLPFEALFTMDKIQEYYRQIGIEAADAEVIYNLMDNYTNRVWDLKGEEIASIRRKFGIKSRHRKARVFDTIVEGWANGYELKIMDAIENLMIYKKEIVNTILDKQFLNALLRVRDVDGKPLLTTNSKLAKELGYSEVKHPNFKKWAWSATTDVDIITKNLKKVYTETKKAEKAKAEGKEIEAKPIDKLENIIQESLEIRGYTEGEARNAIESVKNAPTKEMMYETIETIERNVVEREEITGYKFTPVYGRRALLTEQGALLEESELYAPKKIAKNLNNILGTSVFMREEAGVVKDIATIITKYNAIFKSWILQSTLFHHQAYLRSYYLPGVGELKFKDLNFVNAINESIKMVEDETPEIMLLVRNGLTLGLQQEWQEQLIKETTVIDKWVEKIGVTKKIRDKLIALRERHTAFLFGTFGAGLKAKRALIELRDQMKKFPNEDVNVLAKRVANLINDDFGGLHLQRLGRNPTLQHIMRIFLLAPDWTESNVRTMVKAFKAGSKEERAMYQRFWAGVILKGASATTLCNFALAGGDVEEMMKRYEIAWRAGPEKLKWMAVDITPIYDFFGADIEQRKYWYLIGHFRDPFKFVTWPVRSLKHKGSVAFSLIMDAITGTDWAGRRFSTWGELLKEGDLVKWGKQDKVIWAWFPSYILSEIIGTQPVQFQNLLGWLMGEMHGFDAILNSLGIGVTTVYEEQLKEIRKEMRK